MYVRLVTPLRHPASQVKTGALAAGYARFEELRSTDRNNIHLPRLSDALVRFEEELSVPTLDHLGSRAAGAVFWLKDDARALIEALWELKWALDACGVPSELLTTKRPGRILYEDATQIAAVPFPETGA